MARAEPLESRVARIEEAILGFKEDRIEARADRKEIISRIDMMAQSVQSTGTAVANLSLEKCGERLAAHDKILADYGERLDNLENKTRNFPLIETEIMFWRRVLGGGFHAAWKIAAVIIGSGSVGGIVTKLIWPH